MGSGIDLGKLIPSVLFSFFIFAALTLSFTEMGREFGSPIQNNATFDFNNTFAASENIENLVMSNTTNPGLISSFFPGIPLLMNLISMIKSTTTGVFKDIIDVLNRFFVMLGANGAGGGLLKTLEAIFITTITLSILFIILAALFRQGGFKER